MRRTSEARGPNVALIVIVAIVLVSVAGILTTIAISVSHGVSDGYIPPEARSTDAG
jgi:hypothetical protein